MEQSSKGRINAFVKDQVAEPRGELDKLNGIVWIYTKRGVYPLDIRSCRINRTLKRYLHLLGDNLEVFLFARFCG